MASNGLDSGDSIRPNDKMRFFRGWNTDQSPGERNVPYSKLVEFLNDPANGLSAGASNEDIARLEENIGLNSLRDAYNGGWAWFNMIDGAADVFTDETGVNTGSAVDAAYNATSDYYAPAGSSSADLLITCDGALNSTSFTDVSSSAHTVVSNGGVHVDGPKFGTTEIRFDGAGDQLTIADDAEFLFNADFSIEAWVKLGDSVGVQGIIGQYDAGNRSWALLTNGTAARFVHSTDGTAEVALQGGTLTVGQWHHVAVERWGSTVNLYVDGTNVGSLGGIIGSLYDSSALVRVGSEGGGGILNGGLDEIRVVKGTAKWTANFTPESAAYSGTEETATSLMIHSNTTEGSTTFTDSSTNAHTVSVVGDTVHSIVSKFGQSAFLDGTGDFLTVANHADFLFGSGDFTIDMQVRVSSLAGRNNLIAMWEAATDKQFMCRVETDGTINFYYSTDGTGFVVNGSAAGAITLNTWHHVAIVRNGNDLVIYVDGTQSGATADVTGATFFSSSRVLTVGNYDGSTDEFTGHIDEIRVVKGSAEWTTNFTAPTAAYDLSPTNMTLPSIAFMTQATPASARSVIVYDPIDAVTLNTDLILEFSRDGGTTWTQATLEADAVFSGNVEILTTDDTDISAQPVGSETIIWRVRTDNEVDVQIHGVYSQWRYQ